MFWTGLLVGNFIGVIADILVAIAVLHHKE
jgi:hypothetical protein